jgi:hypothetical protein
VNPKDDIRDFLATRRARLTPEQAGLPRYHRTGTKRFHHPLVGDQSLDSEALELPGDEGQRINLYTAPPGSPSQEALAPLASWAAREPTRERTP